MYTRPAIGREDPAPGRDVDVLPARPAVRLSLPSVADTVM
jgi:hypothetical protein